MNSKRARIASITAIAGIMLFGANSATAAQTVPAKSITKAQLAPAVAAELEYGKVSTVRMVGGRLSGHRTQLGQFTLPAGTWLITTTALFYRISASTKTARPELALKYGDNRSAGLITGVAISPNRAGKLAGSAVQTVTFLAPTNIGAFGSVTNDDGSRFAARQILVSAQVTATRVR